MSRGMTPLVGLASLLWGFSTGWWPIGVVMALLLELPVVVRRRFDIAESDFIVLTKLTLLLLCLLFLLLLIDEPRNGLINFMTWIPVLTCPLIVVQVWSREGLFPLRSMACSLVRNGEFRGDVYPEQTDLRLFWFLLELLSVSMNLPSKASWVALFALMILGVMWSSRPSGGRNGAWLLLSTSAVIIALGMVTGINAMHRSIQQHTAEWISEYWARMNMHQSHTAIGNIGRLKLSGRILMRVQAQSGQRLLLQQAAFSSYSDGSWSVEGRGFRAVSPEADNRTWQLGSAAGGDMQEITVSTTLRRGVGMLALPPGARTLQLQGDAEVEVNNYGAARIRYDEDRIDYRILFDQSLLPAGTPGILDLSIPDHQQALIDGLAAQLGLPGLPPEQVPQRLRDFFRDNFRYSLEQRAPPDGQTFLEDFLLDRREGHCEYFATSAALLLRAAGIPSRYVVGYVMEEYSDSVDRYLVRERHGHAWTQAWIDGAWRTLDYTPPDWLARDRAGESDWQRVFDFFSNARYLLTNWWARDDKGMVFNVSALLVTLLLVLWLLRRLRAERKGRVRTDAAAADHFSGEGAELGIEELLAWLERQAGPRPPGEPLRRWIERTAPQYMDKHLDEDTLDRLTADYYLYRFGAPPPDAQRKAFRERLRNWIRGAA